MILSTENKSFEQILLEFNLFIDLVQIIQL